jgi:hypothetical protein
VFSERRLASSVGFRGAKASEKNERKSEIRMSKSEGNPKHQIQNEADRCRLRFRASEFLRISDFEIRISDWISVYEISPASVGEFAGRCDNRTLALSLRFPDRIVED